MAVHSEKNEHAKHARTNIVVQFKEMVAKAMAAADPVVSGRLFDELCAQWKTAPDIVVTPQRIGKVSGEWTQSPGADAGRVLLYLHGGGFAAGSVAGYRTMTAELGRAAAARTLSIDYGLAPKHPYPAGVNDALTAYRWLLEQGIAPEHIAVAGDSAGGALTLSLLLRARAEGLPQPAAAMVLSPWVDLTNSGASYDGGDPILHRETNHMAAARYLNGVAPNDPTASPVFADLSGLPPLLIQASPNEALFDDALALTRRAAESGVRVQLSLWPDEIHVWQLFGHLLPTAIDALREGGAFLARALR